MNERLMQIRNSHLKYERCWYQYVFIRLNNILKSLDGSQNREGITPLFYFFVKSIGWSVIFWNHKPILMNFSEVILKRYNKAYVKFLGQK